MQNAGIEYRLNAQVLDTRNYGVDLMFSGSKNDNKITNLGGVLATPTSANQEGRPTNSVFVRPVTLNSTAGQGVMGLLRTTDITIANPDSAIYLGPQLSPVEMTFTAGAESLRTSSADLRAVRSQGRRIQQLEFQVTCSQIHRDLSVDEPPEQHPPGAGIRYRAASQRRGHRLLAGNGLHQMA